MPPVDPMLAKAIHELPDAAEGALVFEPKWDGFRCLVFRDGPEVELTSRNGKPLLRYFPELEEPLLAMVPHRCVLDGEVVVATERGLDFDALSLRIHPARSRIDLLAERIPASYVAFDLLALDDTDLTAAPFAERRARLEQVAAGFVAPVHLTPCTTDRALAAEWFERFEGAGFDGVMAKPVTDPYVPGKRTQWKVKHTRTADCVVAGFRRHKAGDGVGSLLLGLYDDHATLHHVGVATSFAAKRRAELLEELAPWRGASLDEHPWAEWARRSDATEPVGRMPGSPSRWSGGKDLSWEPLGPGLVAEVAYDGLQGDRFRHATRLVRFRPDRSPETCTYGQLEQVPPAELQQVFAGG